MELALQVSPSVPETNSPVTPLQNTLKEASLWQRVASPSRQIEIMQHPEFGNMLVVDNELQISEADNICGQALVSPLKSLPAIQRVLIVGGGDGAVLQKLLKTADSFGWPLLQVTLVEPDNEVIKASRQYLPKLNAGAFNDRRTKVLIKDACAWIKQCHNLDAIIYDVSKPWIAEGQTQANFIEDTLTDIYSALNPGGLLSMRCCGDGRSDTGPGSENDKLLENLRYYLDRLFSKRKEQRVPIPSFRKNWTFLSAWK